ncbi:MAG: hypothetical protein ACKVTZ_23245 [Bacteroidia bacterium]
MREAVQSLFQKQLEQISQRVESCKAEGKLYEKRWKTAQSIVLVVGLITPFIVIFRKSGVFPADFWLFWCTITPPLSALISFLMSHFKWKEQATSNRKNAKLYQTLHDKAQLRLITLEPDEHSRLLEWILDSKNSIED